MSDNPTMLKFAPFGIGIHSMPKEEAVQAAKKVGEVFKGLGALAVGFSIIGVERGLYYTNAGLQMAANATADAHDAFCAQVQKNEYCKASVVKAETIVVGTVEDCNGQVL